MAKWLEPDAFRHIFLSAWMTYFQDVGFAEGFGNAHEQSGIDNARKHLKDGTIETDTGYTQAWFARRRLQSAKMDLANNAIGRSVGVSVFNNAKASGLLFQTGERDLAVASMAVVRTGAYNRSDRSLESGGRMPSDTELRKMFKR